MKNQDKILFLLLMVSFSSFFAFNGYINIADPVESNYALTAKEMVLSKDWLSPQIYGKYWFDKPIFFYWQIAAAFKLFGFTEFAARFCPALMGIFSTLLMFWFGKKLFPNKQTGLIGGLILATSFEFWVLAKMVITDMTLFFFFNAALVCFFLAYRGVAKEKNYYYLFYLFCGLATLTKGPIGFLLPGLIGLLFLGWSKNWSELKNMRILPGLVLFLIAVLPWYYAMYLKHGQAFILNFFGVHNYLRATVSEHPKDNVFYYYFAVLILGFFPWIAFLPQTVKNLWAKGSGRKNIDPETKFMITWTGVVLLFFQSMATKYCTYTFPILFPLSLLTARFFVARQETRSEKPVVKMLGWPVVYIFLFSLLILGMAYIASRHINYPLVNLLPLLLVVIIGYGCCFNFAFTGDIKKFLVSLLTTTLLFNVFLVKDVMIPYAKTRSAKDIGLILHDIYRPGDLLLSYGNYHTSATFYSGKQILDLTRENSSTGSKAGKLSWESKRVMPTIQMEEIRSSPKGFTRILVVVPRDNYSSFLQEYPEQWKIVKQTPNDYLLYKVKIL
jgi:4-amino-4-deoxy-L-arabinose transferase-like glycosyltransferase